MGQTATMDPGLAREQLYGRTVALCAPLVKDASAELINSYLDSRVRSDAALLATSKAAGGRWQVASGGLVFAPW